MGPDGCGGAPTGAPVARAGCHFTMDDARWGVWGECGTGVGRFWGITEGLLLGSVDKRAFQVVGDVIQSWSLRRPLNAWRPDGRRMGDYWQSAAA
jgi:hypothetical protein